MSNRLNVHCARLPVARVRVDHPRDFKSRRGCRESGAFTHAICFIFVRRENVATQIGNKLMASYYSDHPDLSANGASVIPEWARKYFLVQRKIEDKTTSILTDYESRLEQQQELVQRFLFFSPAIIVQEALSVSSLRLYSPAT